MKLFNKITILSMFSLYFLGLTSCDTPSLAAQNSSYSNPNWIPPQYTDVRYYYMPDIETYYDLTNHDFIYLENGQWLFSASLPMMYSNYDLYDGFVIALNMNVYQPWMHHHFYISNYPRYYYRNRYQGNAFVNLRGFNENERKPFYWKQEDRTRMFEMRRNDRNDNRRDEKHEPSRPAQNPNYYGKHIGQPVKVKPQMREHKQERPRNNQGNKPGDNRKNSRSQ